MRKPMTNEQAADYFENANGGQGPAIEQEINSDALLSLIQARQAQYRAEAQMREAVGQAREKGTTWEAIGSVLGVSRQAAHSRYAATH